MIGSPEEVRIAAEELGVRQHLQHLRRHRDLWELRGDAGGWPLARRMAWQGPPLPGMNIRIVDPGSRRALPAG